MMKFVFWLLLITVGGQDIGPAVDNAVSAWKRILWPGTSSLSAHVRASILEPDRSSMFARRAPITDDS
jgi:hypothetical protein